MESKKEIDWKEKDKEVGLEDMWVEMCGWVDYNKFEEEWNERLEEEWK